MATKRTGTPPDERPNDRPSPRGKPDPDEEPLRSWLPLGMAAFYSILAVLLIWSVWGWAGKSATHHEISYSEFKTHLAAGEVEKLRLGDSSIEGQIKPKDGDAYVFRCVRVKDPDLIQALEAAKVEFRGVSPSPWNGLLLVWLLPLGLILLAWAWMGRRMGGGGGLGAGLMGYGRTQARISPERLTGISFDDLEGCDEAKLELREVVDFLQEPARYEALGARIPRGVLLVGPPGTGKTLIARAVAGEAKVPFFSLSGSEFVEMFVGVGAARVRDLFEQAKKSAPCIIFIDELDAVGRQRGIQIVQGNDEREQTLNQLLVEMDGFDPNLGVILLAATNRPEVLDRALLRAGRFDRQIVLDSPDLSGREKILKLHARDKPLASEVDLSVLARQTPGFSGADLANVVNEAALLAARERATRITQHNMEEAVEKVTAGPERKSHRLSESDKRRVAFHEVGHALVAAHCEHADPVHKISIIPRGRAALGYTLQLPTGEQVLMARSDLMDRIRGLMGGRASEELVFGEVSTGAQNDLEQATMLAREMIAMYGMGESAGLMECTHPRPTYSPLDAPSTLDCSEDIAKAIDAEVRQLLADAYEHARGILVEDRATLDRIAEELLHREAISGDEFRAMLRTPDARKRGTVPGGS